MHIPDMGIKTAFKYVLIITTLAMAVPSCILLKPRIKITSDFIRNTAWKRNNINIKISRMVLNEKISARPIESLSGYVIKHNSTDDSTFVYWANANGLNRNKVSFTKQNEYLVWLKVGNVGTEVPILGALPKENWYKIEMLYRSPVYYLYIDSNNVAHVWGINPVNI